MKRELKFRVWNGAEMVTDVTVGKFGVFYVNPSNNGLDERDSASLTPFTTKYHNETPVMQFTGLKDKNGVEIYEWDIVRWDDGSNGAYWRIAEVFWDHTEALFSYRIVDTINCNLQKGKVFGGNFMYRDGSQLEVIGNLYQSPELIQK
jgi:uncharacterized phage protein (TIGR01671 family)